MTHQDTISPTLFDLLSREWTTGAQVTSMRFNAHQTAVAFALKDGTVAIAEVDDDDPPQGRIHVSVEDGRTTIRPRSEAARPLQLIEVAGGAELFLSTMGDFGFVAGDGTSAPVLLSPDGKKEPISLEISGSVTAVDHCLATGRFACVSGTRITVFEDRASTPAFHLDHGEPITAIAFSPDGRSIAVAHDYGLTIWNLGSDNQNARDVAYSGKPDAVHWSPGGEWIATPRADGGFQLTDARSGSTGALTDYPASAGSIAWNRQANAVVTSGAFRVAAWSMDTPPLDDPSSGALETGQAGLVPVSAVSSHPDRDLLVAGYGNGFITIAQVGKRDELMLNVDDRGAVTHLAWSRDGRHVAAATDRPSAAIITLPPQMFK